MKTFIEWIEEKNYDLGEAKKGSGFRQVMLTGLLGLGALGGVGAAATKPKVDIDGHGVVDKDKSSLPKGAAALGLAAGAGAVGVALNKRKGK